MYICVYYNIRYTFIIVLHNRKYISDTFTLKIYKESI